MVKRCRRVMAGVTRVFDRPPELAAGIHPGAVIDQAGEIAEDVDVATQASGYDDEDYEDLEDDEL